MTMFPNGVLVDLDPPEISIDQSPLTAILFSSRLASPPN